jgi:hypothetical protein
MSESNNGKILNQQLKIAALESLVAYLVARDAMEHEILINSLHQAFIETFQNTSRLCATDCEADPTCAEEEISSTLDRILGNAEMIRRAVQDGMV